MGNHLLQGLQESVASGREGSRNGWPDAGNRQVSWLLPGDDLRGFSCGRQCGRIALVGFTMSDLANSRRVRQKRPRIKLDSEEYTIVRNLVLERDGWRCQECGSMKNLQVLPRAPAAQVEAQQSSFRRAGFSLLAVARLIRILADECGKNSH